MPSFFAYVRVSRKTQGQSGLGIQAQEESIRRFLRDGDNLAGTYVEVESGLDCERPQLAAAIEACRRSGATLLIAKLDRLSRSVRFISTLMESDVKFTACDMPDADPFRLHIEAAIAEEEARKISARTKAALAAAKARGVRLGGYRGVPPVREAGVKGNAVRAATAHARAISLCPVINELRASGASTLTAIGEGLNARGIVAPRGGKWQAPQVRRLLQVAAAGQA